MAKDYVQNYAISPNNNNQYPLFKENDCTNFICQALVAGGMKMRGGDYRKYTEWFCYTNNSEALQKVSLSWRSAQYFRMYWGNRNGEGANMSNEFTKLTVEEAIIKFNELYNYLSIGDVIQYGNEDDIAYHTQMIHEKDVNIVTGKEDIFVAQHSANRKHVSLSEYLRLLNNKKNRYVYIYHF